MKKRTKKVIGAVIAIVLILVVIWLVYESVKPETASINPVNELPNENMGLDNIINDLFENIETNNVNVDETVNEIMNEVDDGETEKVTENSNSEVVPGTTTSREERAVELAKEYYAKEYGSTEEVYFTCQEINADGRYIVRAGNADSGTNMFLFVNLSTGIVTEQ